MKLVKVLATAILALALLLSLGSLVFADQGQPPTPTPSPSVSPPPPDASPSPATQESLPGSSAQPALVPLADCAKGADRVKDESELFEKLQKEDFRGPLAAAQNCIDVSSVLTADEKVKFKRLLESEKAAAEDKSGPHPAEYDRFVRHVLWATSGLKTTDNWLAPAPTQQAHNPPTRAETYAAETYSIHFNPASNDPGVFAAHLAQLPMNSVVDATMQAISLSGSLAARVLEWSFTLDLPAGVDQPLNTVVKSLHREIFLALAPIFIVLVAIYGFWQALVRHRGTVLLASVAWVLVVAVMEGLFVAAPAQSLHAANEFSTGVAAKVLAVGAKSGGSPNEAVVGTEQAAAIRFYLDDWWTQNVYLPWTQIEFGSQNPTSKDGRHWLGTEVLMSQRLTGKSDKFESDGKFGAYRNADFQDQPQGLKDYWNGDMSGNRLSKTVLALVTVLLGLLFFVIMGGAEIVTLVGLVAAWLATPIMGLLALHPGRGRQIFFGWLQMVVGLLFLRVAYTTVFALLMVINSLAGKLFGSDAVGLTLAFQAVAVFLALKYRQRIFGPLLSMGSSLLPAAAGAGAGAGAAAGAGAREEDHVGSPTGEMVAHGRQIKGMAQRTLAQGGGEEAGSATSTGGAPVWNATEAAGGMEAGGEGALVGGGEAGAAAAGGEAAAAGGEAAAAGGGAALGTAGLVAAPLVVGAAAIGGAAFGAYRVAKPGYDDARMAAGLGQSGDWSGPSWTQLPEDADAGERPDSVWSTPPQPTAPSDATSAPTAPIPQPSSDATTAPPDPAVPDPKVWVKQEGAWVMKEGASPSADAAAPAWMQLD